MEKEKDLQKLIDFQEKSFEALK